MRKVVWILGPVCLLAVAGAAVWGLKSRDVAAPLAAPDAGGSDAGLALDAGAEVDAGAVQPPAARTEWTEWKVSPPVRFSSGETFPTLQEAVTAAAPGQIILLSPGIYPTSELKISGKKGLQLLADDGPAFLLGVQRVFEPMLTVENSEHIVLRGLWLEHLWNQSMDAEQVLLLKSSDVRLQRLYLAPGVKGLRASSVNGLDLEDVLSDEHSEFDLSVEEPTGPVRIRRSLFASERPVVLSDLGFFTVEQFVEYRPKIEEIKRMMAEEAAQEPDASLTDKPAQERLTVEDSSFAGGLLVAMYEGTVKVSRSILVTHDPRLVEWLRPQVSGTGGLFSGTQDEILLPEQQEAFARGESLFLTGSSSDTPRPVLQAVLGTEWDGWPSATERIEAKWALTRAERGIQGEARVWFNDPFSLYPLCATGEEVAMVDKPGGLQVAELQSCSRVAKPDMFLLEYAIKEQRDGWLQLNPGGWVREDQVAAANMIVHDGWVVPLPNYNTAHFALKQGELSFSWDVRVCEERCAGDEDSSEDEPKPESEEERASVTVPEWLLPEDLKVSESFYEPICCPSTDETDGEE